MVRVGKSYREVREILSIPKSTLSVWCSGRERKPMSRKELLRHLAQIRVRAAEAIKRKYEQWRNDEYRLVEKMVENEISHFPNNNKVVLKALIAMLYWAEGAKHEKVSGLKFANTDPALTLLFITLLRLCCPIDETKFSVGLHVHYYHPIARLKKFWSDLLRVPQKQFIKVYIKKRGESKRFRKNFAGICFIYYKNSRIRKELLLLANSLQRRIIGKVLPARP